MKPSKVQLLPQYIIKQIAAGEVVESPSSVVKELVENSIDAYATQIEVSIRNGGKSFISVLDNGDGIVKEDLRATLFKHTTSKLNHHDLYNIRTMGFRGEALFSIAYMSKLTLKSKAKGSIQAYEVNAENDYISPIKLSNLTQGTYIEVRDLFFNFPARLKFLKSDIAEANSVYKVIDFLAMAHPHIGFKVFNNGRKVIEYQRTTKHLTCKNFYETMKETLNYRLGEVMGKEFANNSLFVYTPSVDFVVYGYCSIPTYTVHNSSKQYFFVNKRFIKEKSLFGIVRAAYGDTIEKTRQPLLAIFIDINPEAVDVNVSPSKTEVKFRDLEQIKKFVIGSIKNVISAPKNQKTSSLLPQSLIYTMNKVGVKKVLPTYNNKPRAFNDIKYVDYSFGNEPTITALKEESDFLINHNIISKNQNETINDFQVNSGEVTKDFNPNNIGKENNDETRFKESLENHMFPEFKLGYAKAQYNKNWILAESKSGLVIVDQHAAHERIFQEKLYDSFVNKKVITEMLLLPEVLEIAPKDIDVLLGHREHLGNLGLIIDKFGDSAIIIREYPKILGKGINFKMLISDILLDLKELETPEFFLKKLRSVIARIACHSSIRAGDKISIEEMNELLRQIEKTQNSAECPHGRPTYTIISWKDIEKLFSRR